MKKLISIALLIFAIFSVTAQNQSIYDPNIKATVTDGLLRDYARNRLKATSDVIVLTFEGCANVATIGDFYNGGAGGNYGITWSATSLSIISSGAGGSGNFCGNPSPSTCLFFTDGGGPVMNMAAGFTTGFSFYYSSSAPITVFVWDGPNGTGTNLTTQIFPANYNTSVGAAYTCSCPLAFCHWDPVGVSFAGTAKSVTFAGAANQCGFDDITIGASSPVVLPTVVTTAATLITATGAQLNGTVNANGVATTVTFEWGLTNALGSTIAGTPSPVTGNTATAVSADLTGLAQTTTYYYRCVGVNGGGTTNGSILSFNTTCPAIPQAGTISGPTGVCPNTSGVVYSITALANATGYVWSVPAGATITAGANTTSITVTFGTTSGNVSVYGTNSCTNGATNSKAVTVYPAFIAGTIASNQSICYNTTPAQLIGTAPTGGNTPYSYQWQSSTDNLIFVNITGATSLNYQPVALTATTYYRLIQSSASGCGNPTTNIATVNVYPIPVPTIIGPDVACQLGMPSVFKTEAGMVNYLWTSSPGGVFVTGNNMAEVKVVWSTAGPHTLSVTYNTQGGCSPLTPVTKNITVNTQPVPTIGGNNTTCLDGTIHVYTTETGKTNYQWAVPPSASIISGQGTSQVQVVWTQEGQYWISVNYTDATDCPAQAPTVALIGLFRLPGNAGPITGLTRSCGPVTQVEYRIDRIPGAETYVWSLPEGAVVTSGKGTWSIMVDYPVVPVIGQVSVYALNPCAAGAVSPPLNVNYFAVPATPVVRLEGRSLLSSAPAGNQWFNGETLIPGATGATYSPELSGDYWTLVTLEGCVSQPSNRIHYIGAGIENLPLTQFDVYPIPNNGRFMVMFSTISDKPFQLTVLNSLGMRVYQRLDQRSPKNAELTVDLGNINKGLYFVVLSIDNKQVVKKITIE